MWSGVALTLICDVYSITGLLNNTLDSKNGFIRLGRLRSGGAKGPGIFFVIPCIDKYHKVEPWSKVQQQNSANWLILLAKLKNHTFDQSFKILIKVDLRTITLGVPPQEVRNRIWAQTKCLQCICTNDVFTMYLQIQLQLFLQLFQVLTRDSVTISVDAVVYYRVSNSTLCKTSVENAHHSTMLLSQVAIPKNWYKTIILNKIHNFLIMKYHGDQNQNTSPLPT